MLRTRASRLRPAPALPPAARPPWPSYAALDLGTNNCRLLVARPARRGFRVVDAFSRIVRLGEGWRRPARCPRRRWRARIEALRDLRRQDRAQRSVAAGALCRHRGLPRGRQLRRLPRPGAGRDRARARDHLDRRGGAAGRRRLRAAARSAHPLRASSSISAAARPRSSGCGLCARPRRGARQPQILGSVSLPFGVVTLTERFGGTEVTPATYRAMVDEADGGAGAVRARAQHPPRGQRPAGADARQLGHRDDAGRHPSGAAALYPRAGRRQHADLRRRSRSSRAISPGSISPAAPPIPASAASAPTWC